MSLTARWRCERSVMTDEIQMTSTIEGERYHLEARARPTHGALRLMAVLVAFVCTGPFVFLLFLDGSTWRWLNNQVRSGEWSVMLGVNSLEVSRRMKGRKTIFELPGPLVDAFFGGDKIVIPWTDVLDAAMAEGPHGWGLRIETTAGALFQPVQVAGELGELRRLAATIRERAAQFVVAEVPGALKALRRVDA